MKYSMVVMSVQRDNIVCIFNVFSTAKPDKSLGHSDPVTHMDPFTAGLSQSWARHSVFVHSARPTVLKLYKTA